MSDPPGFGAPGPGWRPLGPAAVALFLVTTVVASGGYWRQGYRPRVSHR